MLQETETKKTGPIGAGGDAPLMVGEGASHS